MIANNPSKDVNNFHINDDVDSSQLAHHHTLGFGVNQAAPGSVVKANQDRLDILEVVKPAIRSHADSNQNLTNNSFVTITVLNTVEFQQGNINDPSGGIITISEAGVYVVNFNAQVNNINSGTRVIGRLLRNASQVSRSDFSSLSTGIQINVTGLDYFDVNDTISAQIHQNSGGTAILTSGQNSVLAVSRVA